MLSAREKLTLLIQGKATLKEINELEALAEQEPEQVETPEEVKETPDNDENVSRETFEKEIEELKKANEELQNKLNEAQADNVHANNETPQVSFDEQLEEMFKDFRI